MKEKLLQNTIKSCLYIFLILIAVHAFEAIVLRMDETFFGENFINKLFGIAVIFVVLKMLEWKWGDIGFARNGFAKSVAIGFALATVFFLVAYAVEIAILSSPSNDVHIGIFTTGFTLTGNPIVHNGIGFILMCVFFNIINVVMEEGTFRGLFYGIVETDHSMKTALLVQAVLFGVWHIVTPLHNLIASDIDVLGFAGLSIGYIVLAGMMGIKWGLMYRMTGSLYAGMADHFFNNCIATNLIHVVSDGNIDEMMIVRILIAQLFSFVVVALLWKRKNSHGIE